MKKKTRAKKVIIPVNYGRRVRNVHTPISKILVALPIIPHSGPKPKRYPVLCHGEANADCIKCYRWPLVASGFFTFSRIGA